jgi:hypothetical protein
MIDNSSNITFWASTITEMNTFGWITCAFIVAAAFINVYGGHVFIVLAAWSNLVTGDFIAGWWCTEI